VTIVKMNLGQYDHLIDRARYRNPRRDAPLARVSQPKDVGLAWNDPSNVIIPRNGRLVVRL
jgi:hypothetical protein